MTDSTDPIVLQRLVDNLTELIELDEKKKLKQMQLRWEFTRQLHLCMPKFWLEGLITSKLFTMMNDHYDEYEKVFGKQRPQSSGSQVEDVKAWIMWEKKHWEEAQKLDD